METPILCARFIPGSDWIEGAQAQDHYWSELRHEFLKAVEKGGWRIVRPPVERTEYDEQQGGVRISLKGSVMPERGPAPG